VEAEEEGTALKVIGVKRRVKMKRSAR